MILIDNVNYLKMYFPHALETLGSYENQDSDNEFHVTESKSEELTLYKSESGRLVYVHSKYNPISEASSIIQRFEDIESYDHVLFYGLGLGHHITEFSKKFPDLPFSIYEPSIEVFYKFAKHKNLNQFSPSNLKLLFIEQKRDDVALFLQHFIKKNSENTLFICLPSYERIFAERLEHFSSEMSKSAKNRIVELQTNLGFEKRWTINSLKNFSKTVECRNIFQHHPGFLKDKPVLLVAAGPSLQYEVENIRRIKEQGLAYIFTVGSGVKALLSYGIHPDFTCTYDPLVYNQYVFDEVVDRNITTIPLIYGTSVGFETLERYPGPIFHMITSQDTVGSFYLGNQPSIIDKVSDAASIAIVTLQLLSKLGANPIILVGQNFAYNDGQFYATGVNSRFRDEKLTEIEQNTSFLVEDVLGDQVYTSPSLTRMRGQMEDYIRVYSHLEFINTTRSGAKIEGTVYTTLDELIETRLDKQVVDRTILIGNESLYDDDLILQKVEEINKDFSQIEGIFIQLKKLLALIKDAAQNHKREQLKRHFAKWDKAIRRLGRNHFYNVFLQPMNRVKFELLLINVDKIRFEEDLIKKGKLIVEKFGRYISDCYEDLILFSPIYKEEHQLIVSKLEKKEGRDEI